MENEFPEKVETKGNSALLCSAFFIAKFIPCLLSIYLENTQNKTTFGFILFIGSIILDFLLTKNVGGPNLIGMKWTVSQEMESSSLIRYVSKPYDYIPERLGNNSFWISIIASIAFWVIFILFSVIRGNFFYAFLSVIGLFSQLVNFVLYLNGNSLLRQEMAKIIRMDDEDPLNLAEEREMSSD